MVPILQLTKRLSKTVVDHSPTLLTVAAVTGVVSTALFTARASFKAAEILRNEEEDRGRLEDPKQELIARAKAVWTLYIPAAVTGTASVVFIIGANHISTRRNAALLSVYSLTETALKEYKDKVIEQIGPNKEQKVRDSIAQDQVDNHPASSTEIIITGAGKVLCYESMTGRYFESSINVLEKAQNDINAQIIQDMYASQNDFFRLIGIPVTSYGDEVGWNVDNMLELQFSGTISEDQRPCISVNYRVAPIREYHRVF